MTQDAFNGLYRAYRHRLVRLAYGRLQDSHLAEDIAQETLLRAYRGLPAGMGENPWPWLRRVAINAAEDLRATRRELVGSVKELPARERAESETLRREAITAVDRAIGSLTRIQGQTIRLSHYEGKSYAEIASIQGVGVAAVRDRLHYSRQLLKTKLRAFADYPLIALVLAFMLPGLGKLKAARTLVKIAAVAAASVTAAGVDGPIGTVGSQAGEPKIGISISSDGEEASGEIAAYVPLEDVFGGLGTSTAPTTSSRRDLTPPIEVPSGPSSDGPGSSGGTIGPLTLNCDEGKMDPVMETLCKVAGPTDHGGI